MAERALARVPLDPLPRILDPACGDGALLVSALQVLMERTGLGARTLRATLHGIDLRPEALEATARALGGKPGTLVRRDALVDDLPSGFDVVLCNPPWVSWSGRHAARLDAARRALLARRYGARRWPAAHALFAERCLQLGPVVALVLPGQVGHLEGYARVRTLLDPGLVAVHHWGEGVFPGVVSPTLTALWDADHRGPSAPWTPPAPAGPAGSISLGRWVADVGVHTGNAAGLLVVPLDGAPPDAVPVLEGRQLHPYRCEPPTRALRLGLKPPEGRYWRIGPEARYREARFLVRQTAAHPIVGPRRGAVYFRNSLLALYEPDRPDLDVRYLVGWLNSATVRRLWAARVAESSQRSFPQVKIRDLRALPLVLPDPPTHAAVVERVQSLLDRGTDPTLKSEIDALVSEQYRWPATES